MSHSTTATSTYLLGKYSKSYPNQRDLQGTAAQADPETNISEWQHFINPTIRLVLDVKQGEKELESVRLRIIWSMDSGDLGGDGMDQRQVVFEDIDLLSLSCNTQRRPQKQQQPQGLPLKAVYRDTVVGIRYLHGRDTMTTPVYRRFQITFMSSSAVLEFIDAIRTVCPCKASPSTTPGRDGTIDTGAILNPSTSIRGPPPANVTSTNFSQLRHRHASLAYIPRNQTAQPPIFPRTQTSTSEFQAPLSSPQILISSAPQAETRINMSSPLSTETSALQSPLAPVSRRPNADLFDAARQVGPDNQAARISTYATFHHANPVIQDLQKQVSLPSSSPPTSSANNNVSLHVTNSDSDAILSSLRESSALYDLPQATLQKLIGDVVREDGFLKLMESVASMWKIKGYVDI